MSFEAIEESRYLGEPITLFLFRYAQAAAAYYGYTDAEETVLHDSREYRPIPIDRDAIVASGTLDKAAMSVQLPRNTEIAELFRVYPPSEVVNLTIMQGHANDPAGDFMVVWTGRVLSCEREPNEVKLTCEPVSTSLKRNGLRRNYQYGCPHALYGPQCKASELSATVSRTVVSVGATTVTLASGWNGSHATSKYLNGIMTWETAFEQFEIRSILRITGNVLELSGPVRNLAAGGTVAVKLGCNRQMSDCADLHDNIHNYGGQPYIPTKNPIGFVNNYY